MRRFLTISMRELLALAALVAVATFLLLHASGTWWTVTSTVFSLSLMVIAVLAVIEGGPSRNWCRGYATCVLLYGAILFAGGTEPESTPLPTATLLASLYDKVAVDAAPDDWELADTYSFPESEFSFRADAVSLKRPPRGHFLRIGHLLCGIALGLLGGKLAWAVGRE